MRGRAGPASPPRHNLTMGVASLPVGGPTPAAAPPRRVASLLPSLTDILVEANAASCLVAVSHECTLPTPPPLLGGVTAALTSSPRRPPPPGGDGALL